MKLYFTLSRRILIFLCAACILVLLIASRFSQSINLPQNAVSNSQRVQYITSLGYAVEETPVTAKQIEIPYEFSEGYEQYNEIQKQANYDLCAYKGCEAWLYSYDVKNGDEDKKRTVSLIVYNGRIIGADVCESEYNGKIFPLKKIITE